MATYRDAHFKTELSGRLGAFSEQIFEPRIKEVAYELRRYNLGVRGPKWSSWAEKKKFCIFFTFFMCGRIFGMPGSRIINFSKISNERSELKMSHMSEFLSEFSHSGV